MGPIAELKKGLRAARALLDWNQDQVAARAGVSRSVILRIEDDNGVVQSAALEKVIAAFKEQGIAIDIGSEAGTLRWAVEK